MSQPTPMKYRRFGRTNVPLSVFSCGGMRFQHKWKDVPESEIPAKNQENLHATIMRAMEIGINHIETARGYGTSEMQLSRVLPHIPRSSYVLQTKVGPHEDPAKFRATFETSLATLKVDYVDFLSLHGINNEHLLKISLQKGGCLDFLKEQRKSGRIRFIGFSTHAAPSTIIRAIETDEFDYVNLHWYFVNPFTWGAIEAATRRDMGVFIISPNDKGGKLYSPPRKLVQLCDPLTPMAFNDLYCLSRPEVHTLSCGAARPTDFDAHLDALKHYDHIPEVIAPIEKRIREAMEASLGKDWCDHWHENIPELEQIPHEVNVHEILRLWTYAQSIDLTDWAQFRYNLLGNAGHWFPGQMADKISRDEILQTFTHHRFASKLPGLLEEAHKLLYTKPEKRLSESDS